MHGFTDIPFVLNEVLLGIIIASGLGSSVGMVYNRIAKIIGIVPRNKIFE